jgi:hypothetical protein
MKEDIRETMNLAKEAGATEGTNEHYIATRLFVKSKNRVVFMTLETNEGHLTGSRGAMKTRRNILLLSA